ncbi:MAG: hypothetical protein D6692_12880, partial [Planctomycetota bacterium]
PAATAADRLAAAFSDAGDRYAARRSGTHFLVTAAPPHRHLWSTWMTLDFTDTPAGGCLAHARFNPSPGIWTGVMLAALGALTVFFGALTWAAAEWMLDRPLNALWVALGAAAVIAALLAAIALGQRLAAHEITDLERFVRAATDLY